MIKMFATLALSAAVVTADPVGGAIDPHSARLAENAVKPVDAIDPFLAGAVGFVPFVSGFYLTEHPERGFVFTLVDILLSLGIYTALHTEAGDSDHVPTYYTLMGINNIADAYFSGREAMKAAIRPRVTLRPHGGVECAIAWTF